LEFPKDHYCKSKFRLHTFDQPLRRWGYDHFSDDHLSAVHIFE
jgi:hypothetical protein